jgi:peptide/nickel transport system permease protein
MMPAHGAGKTAARGVAGLVMSIALMLVVFLVLFWRAEQMYSAPFLRSSGSSPSSLILWTLHDPYPPQPDQQFDLAAQSNTTALGIVAESALRSSVLVVLATALALGLGVPLGFWLALHAPRRLAGFVRTTATLGGTLPAFFVAFLLQIGAVVIAQGAGRTIVPVFGFGLDGHLVIPVLALAAAPVAYVLRLVAVTASELAGRDFVRAARAKGLRESQVIYGHIAPNMLGTLGESALGAVRLVLGGLLVVEYLLVWPGLGGLIVRAIVVQDAAVLLLAVALLGVLFLISELALDLVVGRTGAGTA